MARVRKKQSNDSAVDVPKKVKSSQPIVKKKSELKPKIDIKKLKEILNKKPLDIDIKNKSMKTSLSAQSITDFKEIFSPLWSKYKIRNSIHVSSNQEWISQLCEEPSSLTKIDLAIIKRLRILAKQIYDDDVKYFLHTQEQSNNQNQHIQKTVLTHGTSKDKMAAYTVRCLDSPVYCIRDLLALINLVDRKSKSNQFEAVGHLKTLFKKTYLLKGHVAKRFENHNFKALIPMIKESPEKVEKQLVLWHVDDQVRYAYLQLIRKLEEICSEVQQKIKIEAIKSLVSFLFSHPYQDIEIALSVLMNKLGDTIGGEVSYKVNNLINKHPHMKMTTVSIVKQLLERTNINKKAQYLGLCCLCNILFRQNEQKLIEDVISIYIKFFVDISAKGEVDSKFMSILLRGLNRALPYYNSKKLTFLEEKLNSLYTLCHFVNFNICTQTLQLLFNITCINDSQFSDRFFNVFYEKILSHEFGRSCSVTQFLNLTYRVLAEDKNLSRVSAFLRRLLQVSHYLSSNITCGILYLLSEVAKDNVKIHSFRSLLNEHTKHNQTILNHLDDDDEEYYSDLDTDDEQEASDSEENKNDVKKDSPVKLETPAKSESSWLHRDNIKSEMKDEDVHTDIYLPYHRNPKYCGADLSHVWEITSLARHYHPSVAKFAKDIINNTSVDYSGDPLMDFTLKNFLDRFAIRNPKKLKTNKRISVFGKRSHAVPQGIKKLAIESAAFKNLKEENVPLDDLFCYKYMTQFKRQSKTQRAKRDDANSVEDEEFDDYLDRMKQLEYFGGTKDDHDDTLDDIDFAQGAENVEDDDDDGDEDDGGGMMEDNENDDDAEDVDNMDESYGGDGVDEEDDWGNLEEDMLQEDEADASDFEEENFSDDEDFEEEDSDNSFTDQPKKARKFSANNWKEMLVDADDFSHLLESGSDFADPTVGTSEQIKGSSSKNMKQIKWETSQAAKGKRGSSSIKSKKSNKKLKK